MDSPANPGAQHAAALESAPVAILVIDAGGRIVLANALAEQLFGYSRADLLVGNVDMLLPERDRGRHGALREAFVAAPHPRSMGRGLDLRACRRDGTEFPVSVGLAPIVTADGPQVVCTIVDISERVQAQQALHESQTIYQALFDASTDGIGVIQDRRFVLANATLAALGGYAPEELAALPFVELVQPEFIPLLNERHERRLAGDDSIPARTEARVKTRTGMPGPWVEINARRIAYRGRPAALVVVRDITERKRAAQRLEVMASTDSLTGLANRAAFMQRLGQAALAADRDGGRAALLYIDLDGFKAINDRHGHLAGDAVLQAIGRRLRGAVRVRDAVGRLGGDELVVLIADLAAREDAGRVASKILHEIGRPLAVGDDEVRIGASIGIALCPEDAADAETLLHRADQALYRVKQQGKNGYLYCS